ncbi:hypothetical protein XBJ2_420016 [Xenorhabdus bovienii str. Jollieti]|nr:hypothetical protein XBJ2_420016 [Xenorhabdus bovienii str. Jollieti]
MEPSVFTVYMEICRAFMYRSDFDPRTYLIELNVGILNY